MNADNDSSYLELHKKAFVVDLHCDAIGRFLKGVDLRKDNAKGHVDIPKLKKGAVDLQVFACYSPVPQNEKEKMQAAKNVLRQIDGIYRLVEQNTNDLALVRSYREFLKVNQTGRTGILIGIEGGYAIENDLSLLRSFYRLGARIMTLTHWTHTDWADGSADSIPVFGGLSDFGEKVVKEMNRLGMIIDVSHVHDETFWDVIRISDDPVIASHSSCRALSDHFRNLSDSMLIALAKNGGVIGINFEPGYLKVEFWNERNKLRKELAKKYGLPADRRLLQKADANKKKRFYAELKKKTQELLHKYKIDVKTVVDHIEHVIQVTGSTDYVGLGSDFDGISTTPIGLENASKLPNITKELLARGYKEEDIKKILGGNFLRVFRQVSEKKKEKRASVD
ncbi:MAG: membrane dipeptidase [Calditrichaeota bacterium]|nr:membrane dipeptidase [Calditrichota bacterium]